MKISQFLLYMNNDLKYVLEKFGDIEIKSIKVVESRTNITLNFEFVEPPKSHHINIDSTWSFKL